jgi:hypothetical protein
VARPAAAQCGASSAAGQLHREACVQLLAFARQDGRIDRLRQQRVAEAEAAARLVGHEDAVLDRPAQRLAHVGFRKLGDGVEQRVGNVAAGCRGQAQDALRPAVEPGRALQQHVAEPTRQLTTPIAGGGEELLGEEGVAFGAGDDRIGQRCRQGAVGASLQQRRQLVVLERTDLQHQCRARAPDAIGKPAHTLGRCGLVRSAGRQ